MQQELSLFNTSGKKKTIIEVNIASCVLHELNERSTRPEENIARLAERMQRNGFEITRAMWAEQVNGQYAIFAGGTRFEAAKRAGLSVVPIVLHEGFAEEEIVKLSSEDNENDEYHSRVPITDVWAECWYLKHEKGWTGRKIAEVKGCNEADISLRIKWHTDLPQKIKEKVLDGVLDEGHIREVNSIVLDVQNFSSWLTTEAAQLEFVDQLLDKHRGSSAGIKPTVKLVRAKAKEWKEMIQYAESCYESLPEEWQPVFVEKLVSMTARTKATVQKAYSLTVKAQEQKAKEAREAAQRQQEQATEEAQKAEQERKRQERIETVCAKLVLGDAVEQFASCPDGVKLFLSDFPYGNDPQSNRAVVGKKADRLQNDSLAIFDIGKQILTQAFEKMQEDSAVLLFTGDEYYPEFRNMVKDAGFTYKSTIIWNKPNHGLGDLNGDFAPKHEYLVYAVKGSPVLSPRLNSVIEGDRFLDVEHPNRKPIDLIEKLIRSLTDEDDLVVDPFMGTGSVPITAYRTQRDFWGCEISADYHQQSINILFRDIQKNMEDE